MPDSKANIFKTHIYQAGVNNTNLILHILNRLIACQSQYFSL